MIALTTKQLRVIQGEISRQQGHAHINGTKVPTDRLTIKEYKIYGERGVLVGVIDGESFCVDTEGKIVAGGEVQS